MRSAKPKRVVEVPVDALSVVATGALYREVADQLHVSRRTVETHVANAMRKVQVRNRGELTASYWRHHASDD
jgi:DNA-binding NarL/FixJ family response regulator